MQPYQIDIKKLCKDLNTDCTKGLLSEEAKKRLSTHGPNTIKEDTKTSPIKIFFQQFLSPLMYILLFAALASFLVGEVKDAFVISIAVMINVIIGFFQEWKAEKAASTLKSYEVHFCQARRNNKIMSIEAKDLVPGDIVILSAGSKIPADIRLFYTKNLKVEEAILTGESQAVEKNTTVIDKESSIGDRTNMAYSGTYAISGKGEGIVTATGKDTELGKIAQLITETKEEATPLQKQIKKFSWFLGWLMLAIVCGIFALGALENFIGRTSFSLKNLAITAIALAVAAIPEGLLVAVTVVLAIGMQRMLKRQALVRHLIAAETLGSVSVICTDKTGTLTKGYMSVERIITPNQALSLTQEGVSEIKITPAFTKVSNLEEAIEQKLIGMIPTTESPTEKTEPTTLKTIKSIPEETYQLLVSAILNNDAQINNNNNNGPSRIGNPTEVALLQAAHDLTINIKNVKKASPRIDEIPFSSDIKYMATLHQMKDKQRLIVKGAPEKIFSMCSLNEEKNLDRIAQEMTQDGLRVIAFAYKEGNFDQSKPISDQLNNLTWQGIIGLHDPLRTHAADTIKELTDAGIRTVVVTGDHKETAKKISIGAGIPVKKVLEGQDIEKMTEDELFYEIKNVDVFARVEPEHKIKIVNAWKKHGESVAMIGDGVNDAPALKAADIGVALGSGSDVTHEISDMVLLDNNLSTISAAVRQGRIIFDNIRKVIVYLMADSFSEIILILGSILMGLPLPILATQIFWINLVTDGFPDLALTMEPGEPQIMMERPRKKNEHILNKQMKTLIFIIGIITDIGLFGLYLWLLRTSWNIEHVRTIMFTALAIDSLFYVFSVRSMRSSMFRVNPFKNNWLNLAVVGGALVQLAVIYIPSMQKLFSTVPLGPTEWIIILCLSLIKIASIELTKEFFLKKRS